MKLAALILSVLVCNICFAQIPCNNWLNLPAINSSVSAGDLDIPGNQVTIEATINRTQPYLPGGGNDTEGDVVSKHNDFSDVNYLLRPNHAYITTTNGFFGTPDVCDIELNKVYHVALVYDGSTLKFYRDGFLMSQIPATGNLIQNNWQTRIGWYEPQGFTTQFLGFINEVRIWNVARSQAQIKTYMNASLPSPATQTGLLAYYTFDNLTNKQGTSLYNGTINGSATINSTVSNCGFTVDTCAIPPISCNNWLSTPNLPSYAEVGEIDMPGDKITVEAVFNRTTPYTGGLLYAGDLVSKHNTPADANYLLRPNDAEITTSNGYFRTPDICEIELNKTYHVAMVYNGSMLKFYRNGFLMSETPATGTLFQNSWKTRIGYYEPGAVNTNFIGYINEVRIWNVEKSQAEIKNYMNSSLPNPATQTGLIAYYTFDNLLNKQGNTAYNGTLGGSASINGTNSNCTLTMDSCVVLSQPETCNGSLGASVVNITFGNGSSNPGPELTNTVPGATTNYNYASYATGTPPSVVFDGDYALVNQVPANGAWHTGAIDHTGDQNGYMAYFNAAPNPGEFYRQTVSSLCSGTTYEFAAWVANAINPSVLPGAILPNITFNILDPNTQAVLATYNTGDIPNNNSFTWKQYSFLFTLPAGKNSVILILANNNIGGQAQPGNDLAIDDITFKPCGPLTNASFSNTAIQDSTATTNCNTVNLYGKITGSFNSPSYQWQVSKDSGLNYADIPGATSLNINYGNLNNGKYLFRLLSAEAGNINSVNCRFISNKITLTIISNIDSVRILSTSTSCNFFNFNGLGYTNTAAINKWQWFFDDGNITLGQTTTHLYNTIGSHPVKLVVTDINGCSDSVTTTIIADALPANPTYNITQPTCANTFGSLNITNPVGANFQYSIDGTNYQVSPVFLNLPVQSYNLTVKNTASNCISLPINLSINAASLPAAATKTVIQPSCTNPSGTITITGPLGSNLQYSIDGINYQTSTTFTNLATGSFNLTVKDITSTCVSLPTNVTIDPPLTSPASPSSNITQPVCNNQNGAIAVTAPLGANLQYSIDDLNYQAGISFNNVAPGNYRLTVKNTTTSCISLPATISILNGTGTPASPTAAVTIQPDCIVTTGTAVVSAPLGTNYQYSNDGNTFQAATTFTNLVPGNYNVSVKDIVNGCISTTAQLTVNAIPLPPPAPEASGLQPTCAITTGTINITSPTGSNVQYNINGTAFQSGTTFAGLAPSSYSLTTKNTNTQCISTAKIVVINPIPSPPAAPTIGNIIQPSCTVQKGTVTISAPAGANFEYSIDGSGFQLASSFTNLASGNYDLFVRDIATSCISTSTSTTINPPPALPPTPVARVTEQPTCIISAGTIAVAAPAGGNYEYSVDGLQYQSSATFENLAPGSYQITVKDQSIDCISLPATVVVNANINSPGMYLIPTAFTPNHDGINECFGIKYWGVISEFKLIIYNRWGQTVFSTTNPNDCWDGIYKGVAASVGNYVYYIKAKTLCGPVEKRGNVMLIK